METRPAGPDPGRVWFDSARAEASGAAVAVTGSLRPDHRRGRGQRGLYPRPRRDPSGRRRRRACQRTSIAARTRAFPCLLPLEPRIAPPTLCGDRIPTMRRSPSATTPARPTNHQSGRAGQRPRHPGGSRRGKGLGGPGAACVVRHLRSRERRRVLRLSPIQPTAGRTDRGFGASFGGRPQGTLGFVRHGEGVPRASGPQCRIHDPSGRNPRGQFRAAGHGTRGGGKSPEVLERIRAALAIGVGN